jgi:hypothetical protein
MTTRAQLRSSIRTELNDSGGTPLWSDALLNELITQAIRTYGRELPRQARTTITVVADQDAYNLPTDFDRAIRVEQPDGAFRVASSAFRGASSWADSQLGTRDAELGTYRVWASQIILSPAPGSTGSDQNLTLEYLARYAEPAADGDTIATPSYDDDVLVAFACADALRWIGADEAKRARFERSRGASPSGAADAYERRAQTALAGRKRRLGTRALEVL